ncbi:MAG: zinc-dependent peptidase [Acidimicrobiales bacterium]|nr:zinc-dependent peptidase [Acidimicrobiales bacterium]
MEDDDGGVAEVLAEWRFLGAESRARLLELTYRLLVDIRWETARGFTLTDEMPLTVAAHAALLFLGMDAETPPHPRAVVLHPGTIVLRGERSGSVVGTRSDGPFHLSGQRSENQPMLLSWRDIRAAVAEPGSGRNVVVHEFAHELDAADRLLDGTPPIADAEVRDRWIATCSEVYDRLHAGDRDPLIRSYAGTTPSEFFAVVCELFLSRPIELAGAHPALYAVWTEALGQDPAARRHQPEG